MLKLCLAASLRVANHAKEASKNVRPGAGYFLTFARFAAHRFFVAAMIAALPAALNLRLGFAGASGSEPALACAHLFLCAAAIFLRAAALIFRLGRSGDSGRAAGSVPLPESMARIPAI